MENIDEYFQVFRLCLNIDIPKRWIGFDINVKETHYFRSARDILNSLISLSSYGRYGVKTNNTCIHIIISYYEVPQKITPEDIRTFIENAIFNKIIKII